MFPMSDTNPEPNENCYELVWIDGEGNPSMVYLSGFTIAEVDEKFAKEYPECEVLAIQLLGEFLKP